MIKLRFGVAETVHHLHIQPWQGRAEVSLARIRTALVYAAKHQPDVYGHLGSNNRAAYTPVSADGTDDEVTELMEGRRNGEQV